MTRWVQLSIAGTVRAAYFPIHRIQAVVECDPPKAESLVVVGGKGYYMNETVDEVLNRIEEAEDE